MISTPILQFITPDIQEKNTPIETTHQVLEAGITWVQLRLKNINTENYRIIAKEIHLHALL